MWPSSHMQDRFNVKNIRGTDGSHRNSWVQNAYNYGFCWLQLWFKFLSNCINELLSVEIVLPCDSVIQYRPCQAPRRDSCSSVDDKLVEMAGRHMHSDDPHGRILARWLFAAKSKTIFRSLLELGSTYFGPWVKIARSFVIFPESTTDTQAVSNFSANSWSFVFPSNNPLHSEQKLQNQIFVRFWSSLLYQGKDINRWTTRFTMIVYCNDLYSSETLDSSEKWQEYLWARPRVHANIEAILLVLVSPPFWWTLKCRVTVPWAASASTVFPSGHICTENRK
jgi:hypothetical protein